MKAAKVIVDLAGRKSAPERIQLGEDCFTAVAQKLACTPRDQAHWREISISTGTTPDGHDRPAGEIIPAVGARSAGADQQDSLKAESYESQRYVGPVDLSRQEIIQMFRRAGLADVAAAAQKSLPDPVDSKSWITSALDMALDMDCRGSP